MFWTKDRESYVDSRDLSPKSCFKKYNKTISSNPANEPSHMVTDMHIKKFGKDYRYETAPHPVKELANRNSDNTEVGR